MSNEMIAAGDIVPASAEETTALNPPEPESEQPRDDAGRFQKHEASENLNQKLEIETIKERYWQDQAVRMGLAVPTEDMSPEEWVRAREAQIAAGVRDAPTVPIAAAEGERAADGAEDQPEATERDREIVTAYHARRASFAAEHPDFTEVVDRAQLTEDISGAVQVAVMGEANGPELAYYLGEHPEVCEELNRLNSAGAVVAIGRIAERLAQRGQAFDASARAHMGAEIPPAVVNEYERKAIEQLKHAKLSQEEIGIAKAVGVAPHVSSTIVAMGRPDIALHLIRNIGLVGKLNGMHPMAAAGEIALIARELDSEAAAANPVHRTAVSAPIKPVRRASPASTGLSDDLPIDEWMKRRNAQLKEKR